LNAGVFAQSRLFSDILTAPLSVELLQIEEGGR
jgi:hypothetical protein